jgi:hypothetical protein
LHGSISLRLFCSHGIQQGFFASTVPQHKDKCALIWDHMIWQEMRSDTMAKFDKWFVLILIWEIFKQEVFMQGIPGKMWPLSQPRMIINIDLFVKLSNCQSLFRLQIMIIFVWIIWMDCCLNEILLAWNAVWMN